VDYPFEKMRDAAGWFDRLDAISESDWTKIARANAERLMNLGR
jgi:predicted TIM-barrel fold metal-dependent hydrolase